MRGTGDEGASGTALGVADLPARPVGGKPMLRLLEMLRSRSLAQVAEQMAGSSVADDEQDAAVDRARELNLLPAMPARRSRAKGGETSPQAVASPMEVASAYAQAAENLTGPPTATGPQWRSVGPWTVTNGQTYGNSRVNVSGRISALAVDPGSAAHVLAGAANGGVWESRDRGASWLPRTDYQSTLTVGALAFDSSAPSQVYCGTGEGDWWSFLGNGVLHHI